MHDVVLFSFGEYWWFYALFTLFVVGMLALDLGVFHRQAHVVSPREALGWSAVWIALALLFNAGLYLYARWRLPQVDRLMALPGFDPESAAAGVALEFLAGFIVEKSLSIDNLFVFVVVFQYFAVPAAHQHRVLFYGILGALVFRAGFIALGAALLKYHWVVWLFGAFLILTGFKILFAPEKPLAPDRNPVIRLLRRLLPVAPGEGDGRLFVRLGGVLHATPLFVALVFIEVTDIVFAVDSVPAIFALTDEPLVVYTSNVFAILGLRALYFLLADLAGRFRFLKYGLGIVLLFVGAKMLWLNGAFGGKFPITWSLAIIAGIIGASVALSLLIPTRTPRPRPGEE